jgi:hypothetical protein
MTNEDRVNAIASRGYTDRQARFIVLVMLHSGVCTVRQYCEFSGISRGQKSQDFFATLLARKHASVTTDAVGKFRVFHVYASALYDAIGEPENRNRKPVSMAAAIERAMLLDAVLACQDVYWLATERDKVAHFTTTLGARLRRSDLPQLRFGVEPKTTTRYFPDKLPVGLAGGDETIFTYLVRRPAPTDFRPFLQRHAELLRALPKWRLRLVIPGHLSRCESLYRSVLREELLMPLRMGVIEELRWFFEQKRAVVADDGVPRSERFQSALRAFDQPRFTALYRRWLESGPAALDSLSSPVLADAVTRGTGEVETYVLARSYFQLRSIIGTA